MKYIEVYCFDFISDFWYIIHLSVATEQTGIQKLMSHQVLREIWSTLLELFQRENNIIFRQPKIIKQHAFFSCSTSETKDSRICIWKTADIFLIFTMMLTQINYTSLYLTRLPIRHTCWIHAMRLEAHRIDFILQYKRCFVLI